MIQNDLTHYNGNASIIYTKYACRISLLIAMTNDTFKIIDDFLKEILLCQHLIIFNGMK